MAAAAPVVWATNRLGVPIYAEADVARVLKRLQLNIAGKTVNTAGNIIPTDTCGEPFNPTGDPIAQSTMGVCMQDMVITMGAMAAGAGIVVPIAPPAPGMVPVAAPFALNPGKINMTTVIDCTSLQHIEDITYIEDTSVITCTIHVYTYNSSKTIFFHVYGPPVCLQNSLWSVFHQWSVFHP
jgi:hypothetical protein